MSMGSIVSLLLAIAMARGALALRQDHTTGGESRQAVLTAVRMTNTGASELKNESETDEDTVVKKAVAKAVKKIDEKAEEKKEEEDDDSVSNWYDGITKSPLRMAAAVAAGGCVLFVILWFLGLSKLFGGAAAQEGRSSASSSSRGRSQSSSSKKDKKEKKHHSHH